MNAGGLFKRLKAKYTSNLLFQRLLTVLSIDILVKLSGVLLLPVYLRLMSQEEYGLYNYLISIIQTFSIVLNFGLYIPLSKYYHDHPEKAKRGELLFTILSLLVVIFLITLFPIYFFGWDYTIVKILFSNPINYSSYRQTLLLALVITVGNFMLTNFFYSSEKIGHLKRYNISRIIFINVISLLFLFLLKGKDTVRVRLEATYLVELALFVLFSVHYWREVKKTFDKKLAKLSLKLALPIMISAIFGIVINFSDKFFLEKYGTFRSLSYYYLASTCASAIPLIFASFQNAWLPLFLKEKDVQKNIARTTRVMIRLFFIFLGLSVCILLFIKLVLVTGVIQQKYEQTLYILPIVLVAQIFAALVPLYSNYLIYFEKTYITTLTGLAVCGLSVGLSLTLIPRYGVYGAASVSLVSEATYLLLYYFIVKAYSKKQLLTSPPVAG